MTMKRFQRIVRVRQAECRRAKVEWLRAESQAASIGSIADRLSSLLRANATLPRHGSGATFAARGELAVRLEKAGAETGRSLALARARADDKRRLEMQAKAGEERAAQLLTKARQEHDRHVDYRTQAQFGHRLMRLAGEKE